MFFSSTAIVFAAAALASTDAWAQADGLTGTYYNWPAGTASPPPPPPGSPEPGAGAWTVTTTRIDTTVNFADGAAAAWAPTGVGPNNFTVVWTGYVLTGTDAGTYTFYVSTDDGSRLWVTNPMAAGGEVINSWINQAPAPYNGTRANLLPKTFYPIRYEFFQTGGGTAAQLGWSSANMAQVIIPTTNLFSAANAGVCKPPSNLVATGGFDKAFLTWTAGSGQTSYVVLRGTAPGGPYTQIATGITGTTYTDLTATAPGPYYYVVYGTNALGNSPYSNEANCTTQASLIKVAPTALQVAENGGQATFTVTLIQSPTGQVTVPITSANGAQLTLTGPGGTGTSINLVFPNGATGAALSQTVTVTGVQQGIEAPPATYTVMVNFGTVSCSNAGSPYQGYNSTGQDLPSITCTILPDAAGIVVNPASGLATVNGGPPITFTIQLATVPQGTVVLNLSVSDPNLATVFPLQITTAGFNNPVTVTVTPLTVNTQTTYMAPYDIIVDSTMSGDPLYAAIGQTLVPISTPVNLPPLTKVWGNNCGLLGVEGLISLLLAAVLRRRRYSSGMSIR